MGRQSITSQKISMYTEHFGLKAAPFSITPDPRYLYLSDCHKEALAHLTYGVQGGPGFVLLTGEVGTGKTTLCRCLIDNLPDTFDIAMLLNPRLTAMELLATLFDELRISYDSETYTLKDFTDIFTSYLLTAHSVGRRTVLILDEAQNLTIEVLEQVRLLTNLETSNHKLLQIVLVGQPELNKILSSDNLRQLSQRITARYHLLPLSAKDNCAYINHRLAKSGAHGQLFTNTAMRLVYHYSGGIPRLINIICDRALLGGYLNNKTKINSNIVLNAVQEVRGKNHVNYLQPFGWILGMVATTFLVGVLIWSWNSPPKQLTPTNSTTQQEPFSLSPDFAEPTLSPNNFYEPLPSERVLPPNEEDSAPTLPVEEQTPPTASNLLSLLQTANTESAFIALFKLWGLDYTNLTGDKACQRAATQGLACLLKTGTWEELRQFNRPAVIELVTDEGEQYHVVVMRRQNELATLAISGEMLEFSIDEINQYWLGQFLLLWQPPALPIPVMKSGITNDSVIWIRKHLNIIDGRTNDALSPYFDYALKERVIAFQNQQNLDPDGVVGEQTMLALQAFSAAEAPLLHSNP